MSNKAMTLVWEHSKQRGSALLVMLAIADMANDDLICYPGKAHLSRKCRMSVRGLTAILQKLEESSELKIMRRRNGQRNSTNVYKVVVNRDSSPLVNRDSLPDESGFTTPSESRFTTLVNRDSPKPLHNQYIETKVNQTPLTPFDLLIKKDEDHDAN